MTALSSTGDYSSDCDDYHAGSPTDGPCAGTQGCWGLYYQLTGDSDASFDISPCTVAADVQGTADWYGGGDLWTVVSDVILATAWLAMAVEVFWMLSKLLGDK